MFVDSENAGRIVTPLMSVGARVSAEQAYTVVLVRRRLPEDVTELLEAHATLSSEASSADATGEK